MTDKTTDTLHTSMRQIVDMAPVAPDLPTIPEQHGIRRPVLALASSFAVVLLVVGAGALLLSQLGTPSGTGQDVGAGNLSATSAPVVGDAPIVVVFFAADEPPAAVVQSLRARPEVTDVLVMDLLMAEAEILRGIATIDPGGEPQVGDIPATVRLRVATDEDVVTLSKYAAELEGVTHIDAYFGTLDLYPLWSFQGNTDVVEDTVVTTIAFATPDETDLLLTPQEHATLLTRCLLDAELDVILEEETGITFDNRVVDESTVEACDRNLVERGFELPGEPFVAPRP